MFEISRLFSVLLATSVCASCGGNKITDDESGGPTVVKKPGSGSKGDGSKGDGSDPDALPPGFEDPKIPAHIPVIDPDFPGLDTALVPEDGPEGCIDGYDSKEKLVSLELNEEIWGVRVHVDDEQLFANEQGCKVDGEPLLVSQLRRIKITGGGENNVLIIDLAGDSFGEEMFVNEGAFHADLGQGDDSLLVRGSHENDDFYVGAASKRLMMALTSMARINVWVKGVDYLTVSLGPGDDALLPIQRLNVGLYDVDSRAALAVKELSVPLKAWGGTGDDAIHGSEHADFLSGGAGDDILNALGGNDFLEEGVDASGSDLLNGGEGLDEISYRWRSEDVRVALCQAAALEGCPAGDCSCEAGNGEEDENDNLINFEIVRTGSGDDALLGTPGDDFLYGQDGDDVLKGYGGADVLQGGFGDDDFSGGADGDICDNDPGEPVKSCEI